MPFVMCLKRRSREVDLSIGVFAEFAEFVFPSTGEVTLVEFEVALADLQFLDLGIKS
jgi:hypothetical protein